MFSRNMSTCTYSICILLLFFYEIYIESNEVIFQSDGKDYDRHNEAVTLPILDDIYMNFKTVLPSMFGGEVRQNDYATNIMQSFQTPH